MENSDNTSTWLLDTCSRSGAELLLENLPDGTFLIRPKLAGIYALSIVLNNSVHHCLIYPTGENGFSFGIIEPYQTFNSLSEFVFYYSQHSLAEVCPTLPTELLHPVNSNLIKLMRQYTPPSAI